MVCIFVYVVLPMLFVILGYTSSCLWVCQASCWAVGISYLWHMRLYCTLYLIVGVLFSKRWPCDKALQSKQGMYISAALLLPSSGFQLHSVTQYAHTAVFIFFWCVCVPFSWQEKSVTVAVSITIFSDHFIILLVVSCVCLAFFVFCFVLMGCI